MTEVTNEEKARQIIGRDCKKENCLECGGKYSAEKGGCVAYQRIMQMAQWKDEQPIMESDGWHTEQPTEDGWYLVDTPDFPKNCECVVAEWDNDAKHFYSESSDYPIKFRRWKLIERG